MAILLAILTSASWGTGDFLGGMASKRQSTMQVAVGVQLIGAIGLGLAMPFFGAEFAWRDMLIGATAGAAGLMGLVLLYRGLARGPMAVVAPLTALMSAVVPAGWSIINSERPSLVLSIGLLLGLASIAMISKEPRLTTDRQITGEVVGEAIAAGVGFGLFLVIMSETAEAAAPWPVFAARVFAVLTLAIAALLTKTSVVPSEAYATIVASGVFDTAANVLFLFALEHGSLAPVAVLSSLYPVMTVILARMVLQERLDRPKLIGLGLALIAVGMIAGG
ncbi:MAG: drug/metabolite transporter (DMT)-like permease [Candidatus Poriferisodalaceae bacterium]|jgi:drug/metabolite transporter (DMT)-like permease